MTPYAIFLIFFYSMVIFFAAFVFIRAPRARVNRLFALFCLTLGYQSLIDFGYQGSTGIEDAMFWWRLDCLWPLKNALGLHFIIRLVELKILSTRRSTALAIYVPALFLIVSDAGGHFVSGIPILTTWGWGYSLPEENPIFYLAHAWINLSLIFNIVILARAAIVEKKRTLRRQFQIALIGLIVGTLGMLVDRTLQMQRIDSPPAHVTTLFVVVACLAYATWRHGMFSPIPRAAADNILETMTDALLLFDAKGGSFLPIRRPIRCSDGRPMRS